MTRSAVLCVFAAFAMAGCDTVASGAANTVGFAAKQTVRGGYAVGKAGTRVVYRGGRRVIVGPAGEEVSE